MDYVGLVAGVRIILPVSEPGALLFLGDVHAGQGHGELVATGIEVSAEVEFSVDLIKGKLVPWPRLEDSTYLMVAGSARPLLQALQHSTTSLQEWLTSEYGYDERTSALLMGQVLEYDIANVVSSSFTVVAKIRKANVTKRSDRD
jgi:acetamidase/formamidase